MGEGVEVEEGLDYFCAGGEGAGVGDADEEVGLFNDCQSCARTKCACFDRRS